MELLLCAVGNGGHSPIEWCSRKPVRVAFDVMLGPVEPQKPRRHPREASACRKNRPPIVLQKYAGILTRAIQVRALPPVAQKTNKLLFNSNLGSARKVSRVSLVLAHDSAGTLTNTRAEMYI
jgi:hypothetical protein